MTFIAPFLLVVLSNLFYHLIQKMTPQNVNAVLSLTISYLGALLLCVLILLFAPPPGGLKQAFRQVNWTSVVLGITILGIEAGYLLAYRAGGSLNITALMVTVSVTILLIPAGLLMFSERLSLTRVVGIVVCIIGLVLLNYK